MGFLVVLVVANVWFVRGASNLKSSKNLNLVKSTHALNHRLRVYKGGSKGFFAVLSCSSNTCHGIRNKKWSLQSQKIGSRRRRMELKQERSTSECHLITEAVAVAIVLAVAFQAAKKFRIWERERVCVHVCNTSLFIKRELIPTLKGERKRTCLGSIRGLGTLFLDYFRRVFLCHYYVVLGQEQVYRELGITSKATHYRTHRSIDLVTNRPVPQTPLNQRSGWR